MKGYILRPFKSVDAQKPSPKPRRRRNSLAAEYGLVPDPADESSKPADPSATAALTEKIINANAKRPALYIGMDVHNDSIAVSLAPSDATEVRRYGVAAVPTMTCSSWPKNSRPPIRRCN